MNGLDRPRRRLAIALAGLAGFVDATGFLSAGGYFTSFMSGNTTRLGVDIARFSTEWLVPAGLLCGFIVGVTLGAMIAERAGQRRKTAVLTAVFLLLVTAAVLREFNLAAFLAASVLAMGALNNVFRRNGEVTVGLTYMTGALVRLGQGIAARITGRKDAARFDSGALWCGLAAGSLAGAFAFTHMPHLAPWLAAVFAGIMLAAARRVERTAPQSSS